MNVANYLQRTSAKEGYLVAEMVRTGREQIIKLPPAVDPNDTDADNQRIIKAEEVNTIAKRKLKLAVSLKKGYATVDDQCSQEVKDKLEGTDDWESTQKDQSLHELINKIEIICVGFDDHKQEVFNLVQALKTLFLYSQTDKETVEQYGRNFRALWETVEAFGGSPKIHQGMIDGMLKDPYASSKRGKANDSGENKGGRRCVRGGECRPAHQWGGQDKILAAERRASQ